MQRVETSWRPATAEESFEIVRRQLFQPLTDPEALKARDVVVCSFVEEYRRNSKEFPDEASQTDYERRMQRAYPVHPELFDRLYNDWASLEGFQRTRGVLRLMSSVIHRLWEREDKNLLILPGIVPIPQSNQQLCANTAKGEALGVCADRKWTQVWTQLPVNHLRKKVLTDDTTEE